MYTILSIKASTVKAEPALSHASNGSPQYRTWNITYVKINPRIDLTPPDQPSEKAIKQDKRWHMEGIYKSINLHIE